MALMSREVSESPLAKARGLSHSLYGLTSRSIGLRSTGKRIQPYDASASVQNSPLKNKHLSITKKESRVTGSASEKMHEHRTGRERKRERGREKISSSSLNSISSCVSVEVEIHFLPETQARSD